MIQRVKYPLTPAAQEGARQLILSWDKGEIEQYQEIGFSKIGPGESVAGLARLEGSGALKEWHYPPAAVLMELQKYGLIDLQFVHNAEGANKEIKITLLQELRDAVSNDFDVSDFFLTTNAVGTIIYGNLQLGEGAQFQSAASNFGDVTLTIETLPAQLRNQLGLDFLQEQPEVAEAINDLEVSDEPTRIQKLGRVIQELGRCMGHISNARNVILAIVMVVRVLNGSPQW